MHCIITYFCVAALFVAHPQHSSPQSVEQGTAILIDASSLLFTEDIENVSVHFSGGSASLTAHRNTPFFVIAAAVETPAGTHSLSVRTPQSLVVIPIEVVRRPYPIRHYRYAATLSQNISRSDTAYARRIQEDAEAKANLFRSHRPSQWSNRFTAPLDVVTVTSPFGLRRIWTNYQKTHNGVDIRIRHIRGYAPIAAIGDGVVLWPPKGRRPLTHEGYMVVIDHGDSIYSLYMHLSTVSVHPGQRVSAGQLLGRGGMTGSAAGPHLHLEVMVGSTYVDPLRFIQHINTVLSFP